MSGYFRMSDVFMFQLPRRIIFGNGAIKTIGEEAAAAFTGKKILMVTDKGITHAGLTEEAIASFKKNGFDIITFDEVVPDPPISMVLRGVDLARKEGADIIFGIGGGSVIDAAKAISLMVPYEGDALDYLGDNRVKKPGLPKVFVPTTAGTGSELSNTFVITEDIKSKDKLSSQSVYAFSDLSIIDPQLTLNLPPELTAETGMDAFSHALESFVGVRANPLSDLFSLRGVELISQHIRKAYANGARDLEARYAMCFGVCMGTMAIRSSGLGHTHAMCYPPAAKYRLSHGVAISLMMPSVMEFNLIGNAQKYATVAAAMGERVEGLSAMDAAKAALRAVRALIDDLRLPSRLRDIGAKRKDFPEFAKIVMKRYPRLTNNNPRATTEQDIVDIYEKTY